MVDVIEKDKNFYYICYIDGKRQTCFVTISKSQSSIHINDQFYNNI